MAEKDNIIEALKLAQSRNPDRRITNKMLEEALQEISETNANQTGLMGLLGGIGKAAGKLLRREAGQKRQEGVESLFDSGGLQIVIGMDASGRPIIMDKNESGQQRSSEGDMMNVKQILNSIFQSKQDGGSMGFSEGIDAVYEYLKKTGLDQEYEVAFMIVTGKHRI